MTISPSLLKDLTLSSFTALDFETTGLDPAEDEILEAGLVRVEDGLVSERCGRLFKPAKPLARVITQITGITDADCRDKDPVRDHLPDIAARLEDRWIIAHNAPFDMGFLMNSCRPLGLAEGIDPRRVIDTLDLSRLLLPQLPNHKLGTAAACLGVSVSPDHRAVNDAEAAALIFLELLPMALSLDRDTLKKIQKILAGSSDGLAPFFRLIDALHESAGSYGNQPVREKPANIMFHAGQQPEYDEHIRVDAGEIEPFFAAGGLLAGALPGYEYRKPQQEMALAVNRALNQRSFLLAEAGTGVGKSMAYLYPAARRAAAGGGRVILSTHTKALQDQLFNKELPLLLELLKRPFAAVLLKGRNNYLCLDRWQQLLGQAGTSLSPSRRRRLLPVILWAQRTGTGDIEENTGFSRERNHDIWSLIQSEGSYCRGAKCRWRRECFYQRVRQHAKTAGLVLVNHSLLFSDAAAGHSVLGDYDTLIVDEAHAVEKVASESLSLRLNQWVITDICSNLYKEKPAETGLLVDLYQPVSRCKNRGSMPELLDRMMRLCSETAHLGKDFFHRAAEVIGPPPAQRGFSARKRFRRSADLFGSFQAEKQRLEETIADFLTDIISFMGLFIKEMDDGSDMFDIQRRELEQAAERLQMLQLTLAHFGQEIYTDDIVWGENIQAVPDNRVSLYSVPLDIAEKLHQMVYPGIERCVLTSATLSIADSFSYIKTRLGLDTIDPERVTELTFGSPFDYQEQTLLLAPAFLPGPKDSGYEQGVMEIVCRMLEQQAVGTMVLFTSHSMLKTVHRLMLPRMEKQGITLLGQGIDGPRSMLLKHFQEDRQSVLLGTSSFWEGVDVPGNALELLVITKIPFDVPTDPIVEARTEAVQQRSGNGFINYSVPEAVVRFRQGFGRLIRSGSDRGAVLLADTRITKSRYGRLFLDSLPLPAKVYEREDALLHDFNEWFT